MTKYEFIRFLMAGGINTIFYYILFSVFVYLNMDYRVATLLATAVGIIFSFTTFSKYVFINSNKKLIFRFIVNYIIVYFFNISIINFLHTQTQMSLYLAGLLSIFPVAILTYVLNKFFVFNQLKFSSHKERS